MPSHSAVAGNGIPAVAASVDTTAVLQPVNGVVVNDFGKATAENVHQKYNEERDKRIRAEGISQYIDLGASNRFKHYQEDPWVDTHAANIEIPALTDGSHCKYLIVGAGFGGLLSAARLVQAGIPAEQIRLVDSAGGFGGTWYWNRYPGIMCDTESYIYMPLLEEMDYMPKHKYASGNEMREHAENIAKKWNLKNKAFFGAKVTRMAWDESHKEWKVEMTKKGADQEPETSVTVGSQFVFLTAGILNQPKLPKLPGMDNFQCHTFHTSRWDYNYTGGSPEEPILSNLKDKKVGIIGTGATGVQVVPQLARWAKELYVFQRTPSAINRRDNRPTDVEWWEREMKTKKGWQRERLDNFNAHVSHVSPAPSVNMVDDEWTKLPTYNILVGGPNKIMLENIPAYVGSMYAKDLPHQEGVRSRVDQFVKDKATAEKLKPWYPSWCKRPCFHDEYLPAFNLPNVKLIDTSGKGVDRLTDRALVVGSKEYEVDLLIFGTGFNSPAAGSPAGRAAMSIIGRDGQTIDDKWTNGVGTLHGVISNGFPNLFLPGPSQIGASANFTNVLDLFATHVAYILGEANRMFGQSGETFVIEPTEEAEEAWTMQIMAGGASFAALSGCTPSYLNREGEFDRPSTMEQQMKSVRGIPWTQGILDYARVIEDWRKEGGLKGLKVTT